MATSYYGTLSEFDRKRELWVNYKERLEFFYIANEIEDEDKKKAILLSTSGPETYALFRNLCAPDNPTKTYAQLKQLMQEHLQPTPNPIAERFKFNSRTRQPNENVSDYVAALRQLSIHCDYGNTVTTMLRDRLVCGINSHRIQQKLLTEGSTLTFTSAFRLAVSIEASERNAVEIQSRNSHTHASSHAGSHDDIHHVERNAGDSDKVCYRCGRTGHRPDKCYFKERDCYSCHVRGHTFKVCRKKKQDSKNRVNIMEQVVEKADEDNCSGEDVYNIYPVTEKRVPPLIVDIHIASKNISMEIDTGASLTVMGKHNYDKLFANNGIKLPQIKGIIARAAGPVSHEVEVNGNIVKRHVDQLRLRTNSFLPEFDTHIPETEITLPIPRALSNAISNTNVQSTEPGDQEETSRPNNQGSNDVGSNPIESRSMAETTDELQPSPIVPSFPSETLRRSTRVRRSPDFLQYK